MLSGAIHLTGSFLAFLCCTRLRTLGASNQSLTPSLLRLDQQGCSELQGHDERNHFRQGDSGKK